MELTDAQWSVLGPLIQHREYERTDEDGPGGKAERYSRESCGY